MRWLLVGAIGLLAGCATQAQQEALSIVQMIKDAQTRNVACLQPIETNPSYVRVYQKLGVPISSAPLRKPSAAQLADTERVSDEDITVGLEWYSEVQACGAPNIEAFGRIDPEYQIYFADAQAEVADIIEDVVSSKPTFSHINARLFSLQQRLAVTASEIAANLKARLIAKQQQELVQQQEAADALSALGAIAVAVASRGHVAMVRLSDREAMLARAQLAYAAAHPRYVIVHRIRPTRCDSIGLSLRCGL